MSDTTEYVAPSHWASALVNGDFSGLEDSEAVEVEAFMDSLPGPVVGLPENIGFVWNTSWTDTPDQLAGEYATYEVLIDA
jgi:hypothetical protein